MKRGGRKRCYHHSYEVINWFTKSEWGCLAYWCKDCGALKRFYQRGLYPNNPNLIGKWQKPKQVLPRARGKKR